MSAKFFKNGTKVHLHMNTILKRHSISNLIGAPVSRPHFQHPKDSYFGFPQTKAKLMEFPAPFLSSNAKSVPGFSSISRIITWYCETLKTRPVLTTSITSSLIYTLADFTSQTITRSSSDQPYDIVRTLRMGGYGMIVSGPTMHFWFNFMFKLFPKRDLRSTIYKMFMGQVIYAPIMTSIFFSLNAALQGESVFEIVARLKRDMIPAMTNSFCYWSLCDSITLKFFAVPMQPLVSNSFMYMWTIYTTYMASLETPRTK